MESGCEKQAEGIANTKRPFIPPSLLLLWSVPGRCNAYKMLHLYEPKKGKKGTQLDQAFLKVQEKTGMQPGQRGWFESVSNDLAHDFPTPPVVFDECMIELLRRYGHPVRHQTVIVQYQDQCAMWDGWMDR